MHKDETFEIPPTVRITFVLTDKEKVDLKIMSILTKKTMSDFIRLSIKEKIKTLKNKEDN